MMNTLPPETLCDIFLRVSSGDYYRSSGENFFCPLHISHVCRRWRELAVNYGPLWAYFRMRRVTRPKRDIFDLFQERSNGSALYFDIMISHHSIPEPDKYEYVVYVINTLVAQQHRWCEAQLYWIARNNAEPGEAATLNLTDMPMLTALDLSCHGSTTATIDLRRSQNLRKFNICCDFELVENKLKAPPLLRMTSPCWLTFRNVTLKKTAAVRSCLDFLRMVPALEQIHITFHQYDSSRHLAAGFETGIILPSLRKMEFRGYAESELVLDSVTLPSLEVLKLKAPGQGMPLVNFFERSAPPLRILGIQCVDMSEETVIEVLRLLPTLQEFWFHFASISSRFFRELTAGVARNSRQPVICPALVYLCVDRYGEKPAEDSEAFFEALVSMVESRTRYLNTFSRITFDDAHKELGIATLRDLSSHDLEEYPSFSVWRNGYSSELYKPW